MDVVFFLYGALIVGGLALAYAFVYALDLCAAPAERRRMLNLAAAREATSKLRQQVVDIIFPEKKHKEQQREIETDSGEETNDDTCAICLEPFQLDDSVVQGFDCHHEFHRSCMASWLEKRSDCPICREELWTNEAFHKAKLQVLKGNPDAIQEELNATTPSEDLWQQVEESNAVNEHNTNDNNEPGATEQNTNNTGSSSERVESTRNNRRENTSSIPRRVNPTIDVAMSEDRDRNSVYNC